MSSPRNIQWSLYIAPGPAIHPSLHWEVCHWTPVHLTPWHSTQNNDFFYPWSENIKEIYFFLFQCQQRIYFRFKSPDTKWPGVKWHPSLHPPPLPSPPNPSPPPPRQQFMNLEYFLEWCICRGGWGEFIISLGVQMIYFLGETPFSLKTNSLLLYTCSIL